MVTTRGTRQLLRAEVRCHGHATTADTGSALTVAASARPTPLVNDETISGCDRPLS